MKMQDIYDGSCQNSVILVIGFSVAIIIVILHNASSNLNKKNDKIVKLKIQNQNLRNQVHDICDKKILTEILEWHLKTKNRILFDEYLEKFVEFTNDIEKMNDGQDRSLAIELHLATFLHCQEQKFMRLGKTEEFVDIERIVKFVETQVDLFHLLPYTAVFNTVVKKVNDLPVSEDKWKLVESIEKMKSKYLY